MKGPVCLFDSGLGGLAVLKKLNHAFPHENYIYLADLKRVPFGDKTKEEITQIVEEILEWLVKFNPKLIVMACNTSSAIFSSKLRPLASRLNIPVFGMIEGCARKIATSGFSKVTVWATKLVVQNESYKKAIQKINPKIEVEEIACPKLVPMIEDLHFTVSDRNNIISEYLDKTSKDTEALVLGCTHYPLIKEDINNLTKVKIIDPTDALITDLEKYLTPSSAESPISIYTTAQIEKVERFAKLYLNCNHTVKLISLKKVLV